MVADAISGHGMQVFDLTRLRNVTSPQTFTEDAHYDDFGPAHNIVINEDSGYAYAVGSDTCNAGPHMVDGYTLDSQDDVHATYPKDLSAYGADGTWKLRVRDVYGGDTGHIDRWWLDL